MKLEQELDFSMRYYIFFFLKLDEIPIKVRHYFLGQVAGFESIFLSYLAILFPLLK